MAEPLYSIIKNDKEGFLQVFNLGDVLAYTSKWAREWYNGTIPETTFLDLNCGLQIFHLYTNFLVTNILNFLKTNI